MRISEISTSNSPFTTKDTGIPTFNDMIKNPDYFEEYKNLIFEIRWIEPEEYVKTVSVEFKIPESELRSSRDKKLVKKYSDLMSSGTKFPMPVLDYSGGGLSQEGIHRAMAAELAGVRRIPVMIVRSTQS